MTEIEQYISPLIESQFPSFYREEGPAFISFVKAYYEWLEQQTYNVDGENVAGQSLHYTRDLYDIKDIDKTPEQFIQYFKGKFLRGITLETNTDTKNLIKHSLELYRSKGTQRSVDLLFSLLFNESISVYLPGQDILRVSDGEWYRPVYIEIEPNDMAKTFIGQEITGASSQATALVEGFARRNIKGKTLDVLFLSNVIGNFTVGEIVGTGTITESNPRIIGSLSSIIINSSGRDFAVGDIVNVKSTISGSQGKARVSSVGTATGRVDYNLVSGGTGYSTDADVIVSDKVVSVSAYNNSNGTLTTFARKKFTQLETVTQPLANIEIQSPQGTLLNSNNLILGVNSTPAVVAAGYVISGNTTDTTKYLVVSTHDVSNVQINSIDNANTTGSFVIGEKVYQRSPATGANSVVGTIVLANSTYALIDLTVGTITANIDVVGVSSNCRANAVSISTYSGSFSLADNIVTAGNAATGNCLIDTVTDITASGSVVGSNTSALGIYNITNSFLAPNTFFKAFIKNSDKSKTANIFAVSSGNPGGFSIGSITDTENVFINTDFVGGNNAANVPYLSIYISGANSGFGFVDSVTVSDGGTNYSNSDLIVFNGGTSDSKLSSVALGSNSGVGYTPNTNVLVFGGTYRAISVINVNSIGTITNQTEGNFNDTGNNGSFSVGSDYDVSDTITLSDGTVVTVDAVSSNTVSEFTITSNSTSGNTTNNPTLTQSATSGSGSGFELNLGNNNQQAYTVTIKTDGSYSVLPTLTDNPVTISTGSGSGLLLDLTYVSDLTTATGTINTYSNGTVESVTVDTPGADYRSAPTISITTTTGSGANLVAVMDYGYGFPKLVDADLTTTISSALTRETKTIGTIVSLSEINPGSNNTASPFVLVIEKAIAGFGRKNFSLRLNNVTKSFVVGEEVLQTVGSNAVTISVSNAGEFVARETIKQVRSDGNTVYGELISNNIVSNTGTILVQVSNSSNTFDTSNTIVGLESSSTANSDTVTANTILSVGKGVVLSLSTLSSNTQTLFVERRKFGTSFTSNVSVTGSSSGASGNVVLISEISDSPVMGNNAIISSVTGVANGTIEALEIVDSGFAYRENELVSLEKDGGEFIATGYTRLINQGIGEGYFQSTKGFLSADKYIHDGEYYQEYSYEVAAGISLDKYADVLKQLVQVAGTKLFGAVEKTSSAALNVKVSNSSVTVSS